MKTAYVIFREDSRSHQEIYVDAEQRMMAAAIESTPERGDAMEFDTARAAYEWAGTNGLENWKVGAR